jgi:thymidine kinase
MRKSKGSLEVICGPMFSGKSEELIRRLRRANIAKQKVAVFKPQLDTRRGVDRVTSHNGTVIEAQPIENVQDIIEHVAQQNIQVVGIDEVQFFPQEIINIICKLIENKKRVLVGGLDLDFRGIPFGPMPILLAIADDITKLRSICTICCNDAHFTQRLVNNHPANFDDPIIQIGAQEAYQARCRECYIIDKKPIFNQRRC